MTDPNLHPIMQGVFAPHMGEAAKAEPLAHTPTLVERAEALMNRIYAEGQHSTVVGCRGEDEEWGLTNAPYDLAIVVEEMLELIPQLAPFADRAASIPTTVLDSNHAHSLDDYPAGAYRAALTLSAKKGSAA